MRCRRCFEASLMSEELKISVAVFAKEGDFYIIAQRETWPFEGGGDGLQLVERNHADRWN